MFIYKCFHVITAAADHRTFVTEPEHFPDNNSHNIYIFTVLAILVDGVLRTIFRVLLSYLGEYLCANIKYTCLPVRIVRAVGSNDATSLVYV